MVNNSKSPAKRQYRLGSTGYISDEIRRFSRCYAGSLHAFGTVKGRKARRKSYAVKQRQAGRKVTTAGAGKAGRLIQWKAGLPCYALQCITMHNNVKFMHRYTYIYVGSRRKKICFGGVGDGVGKKTSATSYINTHAPIFSKFKPPDINCNDFLRQIRCWSWDNHRIITVLITPTNPVIMRVSLYSVTNVINIYKKNIYII